MVAASSRVISSSLFMPFAKVARRPVEIPQTIEDGAFDPVFSVALKRNLLVIVVLQHSIEKGKNAGVHQVIELHVDRQGLKYAHGDGADQRKVL